jgi:hypothetical protein
MEKETLSEAIRVITDVKRASSCNYLISHKSGGRGRRGHPIMLLSRKK